MPYSVTKGLSGYIVTDDEGDRVARVSRFIIGPSVPPMVSVSAGELQSPEMALAIAHAMIAQALDIQTNPNTED